MQIIIGTVFSGFHQALIIHRILGFGTVLRTEVLANYTISDYEQQVASIRSFSFRQVLWSDSTAVQLSERIQCKFSGSLRIFEHGTLRWQEFMENPEEYAIEKSIWPEIVWSSIDGNENWNWIPLFWSRSLFIPE